MKESVLKPALLGATLLVPLVFLLAPLFAALSVVLLGVLWIAYGGWKARFEAIVASEGMKLMLLLYAYYAVGLLWSSYTDLGMRHLEIKMSLLFFPLLVFARPDLGQREVHRIGMVFSIGSAAYALFLCSRALVSLAKGEGLLSSSAFSPWFHPSYLAMYFLFAMLWMGASLPVWNTTKRVLGVAALLVLAAGIVLSASKVNIVMMPVLCATALVLYLRHRLALWKLGVAAAFAIALVGSVVWGIPSVRERFSRGLDALQHRDALAPGETESSAARLLIWDAAVDLVAEHPFGSGTGDVNVALREAYHRKGYSGIEEKQLNAHNQFLQSAVAIGIPGMLILAALFYIPLKQRRSPMLLLFLLLNLANMFVEATLETQAGVMFFSFFYSLLHHDESSPTRSSSDSLP
jgi:O-antigen ligase